VNTLNFSWIIDGTIAGHAAPKSDDDLAWLKAQGVRALLRMTESHITTAQLEKMGITDCYEPVVGYPAPTGDQIERMLAFIKLALSDNRPVGVS
jgi:atypical dual specificity phosphatase